MKDRKREIAARREMRQPESKFEEIDLNKAGFVPKGMTRAFRNNRYTVMCFANSPTTKGPAIRVMVQKHDNTRIAYHWSEMQRIKNEIFGENKTAIEYYPSKEDLIDDYNIYWFWIFPDGVLPIPVFS